MDIVNRLKLFMESQRIANSQFADTCRIPRPTLSQLLNGRNKKISDEFIGKIHEAYPHLSVLWLMFGEGEMIINENIGISEPQTDAKIDDYGERVIDFQDNTIGSNQYQKSPEIESNNFLQSKSPLSAKPKANTFELHPPHTPQTTTTETKVSISTDCNKKITNIVVFYNDNSFQSFSPSI